MNHDQACELSIAKATAEGTTVTVRRVGERRFRLHLSYDPSPGGVRVFLAVSLRHLAELLAGHVPPTGIRAIVDSVAKAGVI